ncbi:hypothetical protein, partial [Microbacterium sp. CPCC 204701]|uniref:hypothetical protein n=1 Tax=Microbacterium sp. CPCC 204701 TaxID=2493084 RepID=UPI00197C04D9
ERAFRPDGPKPRVCAGAGRRTGRCRTPGLRAHGSPRRHWEDESRAGRTGRGAASGPVVVAAGRAFGGRGE